MTHRRELRCVIDPALSPTTSTWSGRASTRRRADRPVELVAVTKTFPVEAIGPPSAAGCRAIGENYAQELVAKLERAADPTARGPRSTSSATCSRTRSAMLAPVVDVWRDRRPVVARRRTRPAGARGARATCRSTSATSRRRAGAAPARRPGWSSGAAAGLAVEGLMTVGATGDRPRRRPGFRLAAHARRRRSACPPVRWG